MDAGENGEGRRYETSLCAVGQVCGPDNMKGELTNEDETIDMHRHLAGDDNFHFAGRRLLCG